MHITNGIAHASTRFDWIASRLNSRMSKQNNEQKGRRKPRGRRFTVYGSQVDQATPSVVSTPPPQEIPYISDNTVERLHDMTEDIMALATMQMDFSSRQPYKLKRPVRLASRDMLREWDMRLEHRRLRDQDDTVACSDQKQQNNSSPIGTIGTISTVGANGTTVVLLFLVGVGHSIVLIT